VLHVYLLSEDDSDDQVYVYLLEMLLEKRVELVQRVRSRRGGVGEVRKRLPLLFAAIRRAGVVEDTYFLVAIDNDRAPEHPAHEGRPHSKAEECRHCALERAMGHALPDGRPIPGALAVPVQMIESWLLMMHDPATYPNEATLPMYARRRGVAARRAHGHDPPPQLKDLVRSAREARGWSEADFALDCVTRLDADDLAERSPSFQRFRDEVRGWPALPRKPLPPLA
jgi:hypothetical protein